MSTQETQLTEAELDVARGVIIAYAKQLRTTVADAARLLAKSTKNYVSGDLRIKRWRFRVFLFNEAEEYLADTDPTLDANMPGTTVVSGINNMITYCVDTIAAFHKCERETIEATFASRYATLRVQLSTGGGGASWRVPYFISGARHTARVEVRREDGS